MLRLPTRHTLFPYTTLFRSIIKEDKLGLDAIYLQAKRWEGTVGSPIVQGFAGALMGKKARKGILITTSTFSQQARNYAARDRKSTRLNSSHPSISYAVFCLK